MEAQRATEKSHTYFKGKGVFDSEFSFLPYIIKVEVFILHSLSASFIIYVTLKKLLNLSLIPDL